MIEPGCVKHFIQNQTPVVLCFFVRFTAAGCSFLSQVSIVKFVNKGPPKPVDSQLLFHYASWDRNPMHEKSKACLCSVI